MAKINTVHLFNTNGMKQQWGSRIHTLLGVSVDVSDETSPYMCNMCQTHLVPLEKAVLDIKSFRDLVKHSSEALSGPFKRTKVT